MNPRFFINTLHSLHVQPTGVQFFTRDLNCARFSEFFIVSGSKSQVFLSSK